MRFIGLMCHVDRNGAGANEDVVVLVKEPKHTARLRVPRRHIFGQPDSQPGAQCEDVDQCKLSFDLPAGTTDRSGLLGVPKLTDHGGNNGALLHSDVTGRIVTGNLRAFVTLPEGRYGVEDRFQFLGTLPNGSNECVPRTVIYNMTVPAGTTKVTVSGLKNGGTIELKPTATITITNLEMVPNGTPHFDEYKHLFQTPVTTTPLGLTTVACPTGRSDYSYPRCPDELFQAVGVECSNSSYP
jgi:hypothetical protein